MDNEQLDARPYVDLPHLESLDNLLALFSLKRHQYGFGGGYLIYHPDAPSVTRWISATASEESWLEDAKLLAR